MKRVLLSLLFLLAAQAAIGGEGTMTLSVKEVKAKHTARLMALPGVVSVGIGRDRDGQPAIIVGLDGSHPETAEKVPRVLDTYPVVTQVVGPIKAQ